MTAEEYSKRFQNVISELQNGAMGDILVATANEAQMMIKERIQERGIDANGARYKDYTEAYKKRKQKAGKYRGFTDFSFTTRMWQNVQLVSSTSEAGEDVGRATISAKSEENRVKLQANTERFGGILELSEGEIDTLRQSYKDRIYNIWERNGIAI